MKSLYALLLYLFPKAYREEYGEELRAVFELSLEAAMRFGKTEVARVALHELFCMPRAVIHEHLRELRKAKMKKGFETYFDFTSGSWHEFLTALFPFFLAGFMPLLNFLGVAGLVPGAVGSVIALVLLVLFLVLMAVGMNRGMPRWSLPYLGFLLSVLSVYLLSAIFGTPIYFLFHNLRDQSLLLIDILWDGILWFGLLFTIALLVAASRVSPRYKRFKDDWTLACFVLYGAMPFALLLTFDEYAGDEPYMLLSLLVLAVGAWLYLRSAMDKTRFWILFTTMTLAISIVAVGKAILIPTQDWPFTIDQSTVRAEVKHTIIMWGWFAAGMLLPVAARFLPLSDRSSHTAVAEG